MSDNNEFEQKIIDIIKSRDVSTGSEIVESIENRLKISEEEAINLLIEMEDKEMIFFVDTNKNIPDNLQAYLLSSYAYWYWALITISLLTIFSVFFLPTDISYLVYMRYVFGSVYVLFLPGYCIYKIIYLGEAGSTIRLILFSMGVSVSLISILGLIMNYSPWGLHQAPLVLIDFLLILAMSSIGIVREYNYKLLQ